MALVLDGKFLAVWIDPQGAQRFLGPQHRLRAAANRVVVLGKWQDASPVGMWLEIETIQEVGSTDEVVQGWTVQPRLCFLRWDWVVTAQAHEEKPMAPGLDIPRVHAI
jgi:hypothetical protein